MFCKFCGTQVNDDDLFCPNCGQRQTSVASGASATGTQATPQQEEDLDEEPSVPLTDEEQLERAFITGDPNDNRPGYFYKQSFAALKSGGNAQWNTDVADLLSRKLYLPVIIMACACSVIAFFIGRYSSKLNLSGVASFLMDIIPFAILFIVIAFFGNRFLYNSFVTLKNHSLASFPNDLEKQKAYMAEKGGVSKSSEAILTILSTVIMCVGFTFA